MRALRAILRRMWRAERAALLRGAALSAVVLMAGVALLGLSGWFITAAGLAGMLGLGLVFDVFRPSAGVRMLALGRTAARYGERLITHDAVLRVLASLRVALLERLQRLPYGQMLRLRGAQTLNRLTADVDALDGVALRLAMPLAAGAVTLAISGAMLAWLVAPAVALWSVASFTLGAAAALIWAGRRALAPSRRAELAQQAFRMRLIDALRAASDLAVQGRLHMQRMAVLDAEARLHSARDQVNRVERRAGFALSVTVTLAAAGALWLGSGLAQAGQISVAALALGFFATLALGEITGPLRRGMADLGRMMDAARRVERLLAAPDPAPAPAAAVAAPRPDPTAPALAFAGVSLAAPGSSRPVLDALSFDLAAGECVAMTGRSGSGKSLVLALAAGLIAPDAGRVLLAGQPLADWPEADLRARLALLPQRAALMRGTVFEALALARPDLTEAEAMAVLEAVQLTGVVAQNGGLSARLGDGGAGLSGGEARRLTLARAILRRPQVLLLDEPTEGLDRPTAEAVLRGIRHELPAAALLIASHRAVEQEFSDRLLRLDQAAATT